ncbi:protein kinase, partial [bacterium]|nr:protein kinase [bacterium]
MTTPDTNINGYLKQYHLVKELKQSAWEETYLVEDPEDSGLYVLTRLNKNKIISRLLDDIGGLKDPCETEDEALEEFKKNDKDFKKCLEGALEIPAHPNVARVISVDHDQFKEQHFAIIEYVEGKPIKDETKGLSTIRKLQLIIQTFEGLSHLHEYETLHLRIKPDNIFVFRDGKRFRAKFINPGYAVHRDNWNHIKSVGPKYWVAPEVVFEKGADEKSDLYMMAALSYYLLSGKKPYPKRKAAENDVKKLREIIKRDEVKGKERPPSLINLVPDV